MRRFQTDERGWAIVVSMAVMALMILIGLAILSTADTQSQQSRQQRERDSAFNMAEAALGDQVYVLSRNWPGSVDTAFNTTCNQSGGAADKCPTDAQLRANFAQTDPATNVTTTQPDLLAAPLWTTSIFDDATACSTDYSTYYFDTITSCATAKHYDAGGPQGAAKPDNQVWVRAEAKVRGHKRVLVGRAQIQQLTLPFPKVVITAGKMSVSGSGNSDIQTGGTNVQLRCTVPPQASCANYAPSQIQGGGTTTYGYTGGDALSDSEKLSTKQTAIAQGHYCRAPGDNSVGTPASSTGFCNASGCGADLGNTTSGAAGWVVWLAGPTAVCRYNGSNSYNCASSGSTSPGIAVIGHGGPIALSGTADFCGLLYSPNDSIPEQSSIASPLIELDGTGTVFGAVAVDGAGSIDMGQSSHTKVFYDGNIVGGVTVNGSAGIIQNTWRQIQ